MENTNATHPKQELEKFVLKRVKRIKDFYIHTFVYAIGLSIYILKTYFGLTFNFFPIEYINDFVMAIWTFIFVTDAIYLFFIEVVFGKKWEIQKVKKMIESENQEKTWE